MSICLSNLSYKIKFIVVTWVNIVSIELYLPFKKLQLNNRKWSHHSQRTINDNTHDVGDNTHCFK